MSKEWSVTYNSGQPSLVQLFKPPDMKIDPPDLKGLSGATLVKQAMTVMEPGQTVADPCIGLGHTLRAGEQMGLRVIGMELNPDRLAQCLKWGAKRGMLIRRAK